ncbi:putative conserved glycine-rich protein [Rosellinia necatrix]|uniref:Putative conserved glycine-rich protein n=1 Tax=Rosellinia necatrix TaxID=77044 RepID=A0A1W2TBK0_ROSNE|nr:putative conserved glycine-rich protein [Rosellinia necatrix]
MKPVNALLGLATLAHGISAVAVPEPETVALDARTPEVEFETRAEHSSNEELWKRKGGGGGGGRGGGGGGGRGSSGGSSGGRTSGRGSTSDNSGGRTTTGSGPRPSYGGGGFYSGGAAAPYTAGKKSGSIAPALLTGAAIGGIGFLGVSYLAHGAYVYPFYHPYYYHNATTDKNETKPVVCVCEPYNPCACEDNGNSTYFNSVIGDGSYQNLNHSIVTIAPNETTKALTIYINGGLPNGTTAAGGTDELSAAGGMVALARAAGWWPAATAAFALAFIM